MPLIHLATGQTEQALSFFPDRNFATEFYADEVDTYLGFVSKRLQYLEGGHIKDYEGDKEDAGGGRFIIRVRQNVEE